MQEPLESHLELPEGPSVPRAFSLRQGAIEIRQVRLQAGALAIGRHAHNDVVLDDLTVSGEHAVIIEDGEQLVLHDLDSRNGTRLNTIPVHRALLRVGDQIGIGSYHLIGLAEHADVASDPVREETGAWLEPIQVSCQPAIAIDRRVVSIRLEPGCVDVVSRRNECYGLTHLEGDRTPSINGEELALSGASLAHGDIIDFYGRRFRFCVEGAA